MLKQNKPVKLLLLLQEEKYTSLKIQSSQMEWLFTDAFNITDNREDLKNKK